MCACVFVRVGVCVKEWVAALKWDWGRGVGRITEVGSRIK